MRGEYYSNDSSVSDMFQFQARVESLPVVEIIDSVNAIWAVASKLEAQGDFEAAFAYLTKHFGE